MGNIFHPALLVNFTSRQKVIQKRYRSELVKVVKTGGNKLFQTNMRVKTYVNKWKQTETNGLRVKELEWRALIIARD